MFERRMQLRILRVARVILPLQGNAFGGKSFWLQIRFRCRSGNIGCGAHGLKQGEDALLLRFADAQRSRIHKLCAGDPKEIPRDGLDQMLVKAGECRAGRVRENLGENGAYSSKYGLVT